MSASDDIIVVLQQRVDQRRREGRYPVGLEQQLQAEFDAIMSVVHADADVLDQIAEMLEGARQGVGELRRPIPLRSRIPGLFLVHWVMGKLVRRHVSVLADRMASTLEMQQQALDLMRRQLEIQRGADSRVLNQLGHAMHDRLMMIDVLAEAIVNIESKVDREA